jgi:hypothetical protein
MAKAHKAIHIICYNYYNNHAKGTVLSCPGAHMGVALLLSIGCTVGSKLNEIVWEWKCIRCICNTYEGVWPDDREAYTDDLRMPVKMFD